MDFEAYVGRLTASQTVELLEAVIRSMDGDQLIATLAENLVGREDLHGVLPDPCPLQYRET